MQYVEVPNQLSSKYVHNHLRQRCSMRKDIWFVVMWLKYYLFQVACVSTLVGFHGGGVRLIDWWFQFTILQYSFIFKINVSFVFFTIHKTCLYKRGNMTKLFVPNRRDVRQLAGITQTLLGLPNCLMNRCIYWSIHEKYEINPIAINLMRTPEK